MGAYLPGVSEKTRASPDGRIARQHGATRLTQEAHVAVQAMNRQWRLIERPSGMVGVEHFACREEPVPVPQDGDILV